MSGSRHPGLSRRAFAALVLSGAAGWASRVLARDPDVADRGLGGTGVAPIHPDETLGQDRGIGGTGVIGTIRRFGSIVVNDLRVTFPPNVRVSIDGRRATTRDLKLGHVVRVLARQHGEALATRAIVADSEVVGMLEARDDAGLVVLGQRVEVPDGVAVPPSRLGDTLAVSGLRRPDGVIVASLVERRRSTMARLHGPVTSGPGLEPVIGGVPIAGLSPALVGRRVSLVGWRQGGRFRPMSVRIEPRLPFAAADRLSLEAYVARGPEGLHLGSGLDVSADAEALAAVGPDESVRAVVVARPGPAGRLDAESLRVEHDTHGRGGAPAGRQRGGPAGLRGGADGARGGPGGPGGPASGRGRGGGPGR